jgi:hypothetical protein
MGERVLLAAAIAGLSVALAPRVTRAEPDVRPKVATLPQATDVVTEEESVPNRGVIVAGAVMFGVPYAASVIVASESGHPGDSHLYVPILGPWLDLGDRGGCPAFGSCDTETTNKVLLVGNGLLQSIGVLQIIGGFVFQETRVVTRARPATALAPTLRIAPGRVGPGAYGLLAVGSF